MSIREFVKRLMKNPQWAWLVPWMVSPSPRSVIVEAGGRVWDTGDLDRECPEEVTVLGWGGVGSDGIAYWTGLDLDVGHGARGYESTDLALADAFRVRHLLEGQAEIRLSRSGLGVHIRHRFPSGSQRPGADAAKIAKGVAGQLGLRADPTPLGRQVYWFWCTDPAPHAFELIRAHEE